MILDSSPDNVGKRTACRWTTANVHVGDPSNGEGVDRVSDAAYSISGLTLKTSRAAQRHDRTDGQARRLHFV
jgi:hypothetical protein